MLTEELLFVTGNQNKVHEARRYLPSYTIKNSTIEVPEIQSVDVMQVIQAKLESAFQQIRKPCFVMDASLVINGLCKHQGNEPKRFPGALIKDVFENMGDKNIAELVRFNHDTDCLWRAVLGYWNGSDEYYFEASLAGDIAYTPRGTNGYDWDTLFVPKGQDRTFAEMSLEEKQSFALTKDLYRQFREFLNQNSMK